MLPLQDLNPTRRTPILTWALIIINVLVFLWQQTLTDQAMFRVFIDLSVVPVLVIDAPFALETFLDVLRSMFFHGGWAHLFGNMLYLYLFGDNVEDRLGRPLFLILYFISGYLAAMAQVQIEPGSEIPLVGASGAIAGVLGSYLVLFPGVKVRGIVPLGVFSFFTELPAVIVLGFWFVLQIFDGFASLGVPTGTSGGVAFFAHIGGFVAGMAITGVCLLFFPQPSAPARRQMLYERAQRYRY